MAFFEWLEHTALAVWVGESMLGYPLMLSLHAVGLAMAVGVFSVLGLRLLGLFRVLPLSAFVTPIRIAWFGCLVNGLSGVALFASQASSFVSSAPFPRQGGGCGVRRHSRWPDSLAFAQGRISKR